MKIIQLVTQMEAGGAQKVASLLADGLRKRGHEAQMWFLYQKTPAYEQSAHVRVLFPQRPVFGEFAELGLRLWKSLMAESPDIVISHTHSANAFAAPIAALARVPVRIAVHHNPVETYSMQMRFADRLAFATGSYSAMVTVSGGVLKSFADRSAAYQRRLHRIYNSISMDDLPDNIDIREQNGIPQEAKLLVNVGRLTAQKNQGILLQLLQRIPDVFLLLVGAGEMQRKLLKEASALGVLSRLKFTGEVPPERVAAILQQADIFLMPSRYESFCLAAVEAMHHGVPVVASDVPCLREVLGNSQLFFPMNDLSHLTKQVQYLLDHEDRRREIGNAGHVRADQFTIDRMVGEYECLLAEALLYARPNRLAANNLRRIDALGRIARVHDHL